MAAFRRVLALLILTLLMGALTELSAARPSPRRSSRRKRLARYCRIDAGVFELAKRDELGDLWNVAEAIAQDVCDHLNTQVRPVRRQSGGRWTDEVDAVLGGHVETIRSLVDKEHRSMSTPNGRKSWEPWVRLHTWVSY